MKRLFMIAVALLALGSVANAQQSMSDESLEFRPHWSLGVQGGAAYTLGEASFAKLLSPAAQLSATYHFHHAFGVRAGISGWQGKGGLVVSEDIYRFRYGQLSADFTVDLASLISGFDHQRVFSPYLFAGIGGAYGFNNEEAAALATNYGAAFPYLWDTKAFVVGRLGAGVDFWVTKAIALGLEGNANMFSDKLNSKEAGKGLLADWQFNLLAGVKFRLGDNTRPSEVYAAQVAAAEAAAAAAAALAAEKAAAEKAAAEKAAAEKAAAEKAAAEKAAAEKAAAEKAAAEKAAIAAEHSEDVFFTIDSYYIRVNEGKKLEKLAAWMKENPDFTVTLVGYADKKTGTYEINQRISERRANAVKDRLIKLGVPADRIMTFFKGDTVQPFAENAKNRVVICELE
ncbi:MAG: OmpA family protein [Bacteroidales bacterium]|nr:OmpA family protein [Bacteroidales bacterium]